MRIIGLHKQGLSLLEVAGQLVNLMLELLLTLLVRGPLLLQFAAHVSGESHFEIFGDFFPLPFGQHNRSEPGQCQLRRHGREPQREWYPR